MIKIFLIIALFFFISICICSKPSLSDKIAQLDEWYQKLSVEFLREEPKILNFEGKLFKIDDVKAMSRFMTYAMLIAKLDIFYKKKTNLFIKLFYYMMGSFNFDDFKLIKDGNTEYIFIHFPPALLSLLTAIEQPDFSKLNWLPILDENNNLIFSPEDQYFLLKHVFDVESSSDPSEEESVNRRNFCSLSGFEENMLEDYRGKQDGVDKFKTILGFMKQLRANKSNESCLSLKLSLNGCEPEYVIKFDYFFDNEDLESEEKVDQKAQALMVALEGDLKWTDDLDTMLLEKFKAKKVEEGKPIEHQNYGGGGIGGPEVGENIFSEEDNLGDHTVEHSTEAPSTPENNISTDPIKDKPSDQDELKPKKAEEEEGKPRKNQNYGGGGPEVSENIFSEEDDYTTPSDSLENDNTSSLAENSIESISPKTTSNPPDSNISTDLIKPSNQDDSKASTTNDPNSSKKPLEVELSTKSSIQPNDPVKTGSSVHGEIVNEKTNIIKSSAEAKDDDYMFEHILICFSVLAVLVVVGVVFYNKRSKAPATDL
jgi:hypothetical protein